MKALIIRSPYIGWILDGDKTWELRSRPTLHRGRIGLIEKGTGTIVGVTNLVDSLPPLSSEGFAESRDRHRIPEKLDTAVIEAGWVYPWVFQDSRRLTTPVFAKLKRGQVIWVSLENDIILALSRSMVN